MSQDCIERGGGAISGAHVPEGAMLLCLEGMANRDPRRWNDPDRLDVLRARSPNMGFGFGRHTCLGIHLARLETQVWSSAYSRRSRTGRWPASTGARRGSHADRFESISLPESQPTHDTSIVRCSYGV